VSSADLKLKMKAKPARNPWFLRQLVGSSKLPVRRAASFNALPCASFRTIDSTTTAYTVNDGRKVRAFDGTLIADLAGHDGMCRMIEVGCNVYS